MSVPVAIPRLKIPEEIDMATGVASSEVWLIISF